MDWWILSITLEYLGSTVIHVFVTGLKCETLGPCYSEPCDENNTKLSCEEYSNLTDYTCSCKTGRSPSYFTSVSYVHVGIPSENHMLFLILPSHHAVSEHIINALFTSTTLWCKVNLWCDVMLCTGSCIHPDAKYQYFNRQS